MTVFPLVIHIMKTSQRCIAKECICHQMRCLERIGEVSDRRNCSRRSKRKRGS
uniref:Uncharacterized protein n=1 Tax=Cucumis melo TaxID=3656 RepID=A0A9I9EGG2_CUCME